MHGNSSKQVDANGLTKTSVTINLVYAGLEEEGQRFTQQFTPFSSSLVEAMIPWTELADRSAGGALARCDRGASHNMQASVVRNLDKATMHELYESYSSFLAARPILVNSTVFLEIFAQQGVDAHPDDFSAFPHRGEFSTQLAIEMAYYDSQVNSTVAQDADAWAAGWRDRISRPEVSGYDQILQYQNYAHGDEPISAVYGYDQWRHERLTNLKQAYDPQGHFNGYHAVPDTLAGWD